MATAANRDWDLRQLSWLVKLEESWGCNSHVLPSKAISTAIPDPGILASTTAPISYSCWHHLATLPGHHRDSYSCCYSQLPQLLLPSLVPQNIAFIWFLLLTPPHYTTTSTSVLLPCNPHFQHALVLNCHDSCSCVAVWSIYQPSILPSLSPAISISIISIKLWMYDFVSHHPCPFSSLWLTRLHWWSLSSALLLRENRECKLSARNPQ